jgi:hypothetical protein
LAKAKASSQISKLLPCGWSDNQILADYSESSASVPTIFRAIACDLIPGVVTGEKLPKVTSAKLW